MTAIIELDDDTSNDEAYLNFIEELKADVTKAIFFVQKADGLYYIGTRSKNKNDLIADIYRLQKLAERIISEMDEVTEETE